MEILFSYPDKVLYEQKTGQDKSLNNTYATAKFVQMKYVKGKDVTVTTSKGVSNEHRRLYRSPFELNEGDRLDGKTVVAVEPPSRDVFNKTLAYKAWVK